MPTMKLEIVTAERQIFSGDVTTVIAEGTEGQMTVLPKHAPLITMLAPGELVIRKDGDEQYMVITGGFMEVMPEKVIVLADSCERCDEIDLERAAAAKQRAEERLKSITSDIDQSRAEAALRRSLARLRVAEKRRRTPGYKPRV
ncbi:MAG: F0F1 ATP synthase subunit epsilon [Dehalococcoidia bacterium]